jgi:hypothetical protein
MKLIQFNSAASINLPPKLIIFNIKYLQLHIRFFTTIVEKLVT